MLAAKKFKEHIKNVEWVILDEIHSMAESKRGVHLSLFLEHLQFNNPGICRVGLSATVSPIEKIAKFLVGTKRDCKYIDISYIKKLDLEVISPVKDLINTDLRIINNKTYEKLHELIRAHKTTLIFTNTRAATERIVHSLKEKFPKEYYEADDKEKSNNMSLIGAHHGSLSKDHRFDIEQKLRDGKLKAVVCSTSLELGIDIGSVDLVILLGSPKGVARALQRSGRAGHQLNSITKARIIVTDRDDLMECSVLLKNAIEHKIDKIHIPENAYDVLVQHVLGFVIGESINIDELFMLTKRSYCYRNLSYEDYLEVIRYLSGSFESLENRFIFSKIRLSENKFLIPRGIMTRVIYSTNLGTIPSSGGVIVKIGEYPIGMIDENFLERLKPGDTFLLGGDVYQFRFARGMVAQVSSAYNKSPTVPRWFSETLPLSFDLANGIQKFRGFLYDLLSEKKSKNEILKRIKEYTYVNDIAAEAIYNYCNEEFSFVKEKFPRNDILTIEIFHDEIFRTNKYYHIFHSLNGRKVNEALSRVFALIISRYHRRDIEIGINDNGFYLASNIRLNVKEIIGNMCDENIEHLLLDAIEDSEILRRRFRHCAERSFMILRNYKGKTKRVGRQQVSSMILLKAAKKISENFIILKEAKREVIEDVMDIKNTKFVFNNIIDGILKLNILETSIPSPFATNLVLQGYSDIVTVEDRHTFLQTMHKLVQAKIKTKDLNNIESFNYEKFWTKKEIKKENDLKKQFSIAFKKLKTPAYVCEEVLICIENLDKKLSDKTEQYFLKEFSNTVNKYWTDEIIEFIRGRF